MYLTVRTQTGGEVLCNSDHIVAVQIPSVVDNDPQCKVFLYGPVMLGVTHAEAERVRDILVSYQATPMMKPGN